MALFSAGSMKGLRHNNEDVETHLEINYQPNMLKVLERMMKTVHQGVQDYFKKPDVASTGSATTLALAAITRDLNKKITVHTHTVGDSPVYVVAKKPNGTFVIQQITTDENVPTQPNMITNCIDKSGIAHITEPLSFTEQELRQRLGVDSEAQLAIIAACDGLLAGLPGTVQRSDGLFRFLPQDPQKQYNQMRQGNLNILAAYLTENNADIKDLAPSLLAFALGEDPAKRRQQSSDNITVIAVPIASVDAGKTAVSIVCDGNQGSAVLAELVIKLYTEKLELLAPPQNQNAQQPSGTPLEVEREGEGTPQSTPTNPIDQEALRTLYTDRNADQQGIQNSFYLLDRHNEESMLRYIRKYVPNCATIYNDATRQQRLEIGKQLHKAVVAQRNIAGAEPFKYPPITEDDIRAPMEAFEDFVKQYEKTSHDIRQSMEEPMATCAMGNPEPLAAYLKSVVDRVDPDIFKARIQNPESTDQLLSLAEELRAHLATCGDLETAVHQLTLPPVSVAEIESFYKQYSEPYKAIEALNRNADQDNPVDVAAVLGAMYALKHNLRQQGDTYFVALIKDDIEKLVDPKSLTQDSENVNFLTQDPSAFREAAQETIARYNWVTQSMMNAQSSRLS